MKILFIGTVEFSLMALKKLISMDENIVGVITKSKSDFNSDFADLTSVCRLNSIPYIFSDNINDTETEKWIKEKQPEIGLCFGWSQIIKQNILNIPTRGIVGFHPANLPQNRGRHPIIWALFLGLQNTASTFFIMDKGADSGLIISQEKIQISYEETAGTLYNKITSVALKQIEYFIPSLKNNTIKALRQDETESNIWRKRGIKDGVIDFRMCSYAIYNLVRALTHPYIGAHLIYKGQEVKIWRVEEVQYSKSNIEPGYIIDILEDNSIIVKTYDNAIKIIEHEFIELPLKSEYL